MRFLAGLCCLFLVACSGEKLHPSVPVGGSCMSTTECAAGGLCLSGICRASCSATVACSAGFECKEGGCVPTTCGNGMLEGDEACDDGNMKDGDGCSATCQVEAGHACSGTPSKCVTCDDPDPLNCTSTFAYSDWSDWGTCSATCGTGTQERTRTCRRSDGMTADCARCGGVCSQSSPCQAPMGCAMYSDWSDWSACTNGMETRTRTCVQDGTTVDCSACGGDCSATKSCVDCSMWSTNVAGGTQSQCDANLAMAAARCQGYGCTWNGPTTCIIGGSPSCTSCLGGYGACQ